MVFDIVIIGSGGAALSAALAAREKGAKIAVVSEGYPTRSQTCMAQGGINAALGNIAEDSARQHAEDTCKASGQIASRKMIDRLCLEAVETVKWLDSIGVPFSRLEDGKIAQRQLGGASVKRACYSQDYTGLKILHTLYDNTLKEGITFFNEYFLLDLLSDNGQIAGAHFYDIRTGSVETLLAKSVILATGGYGGIYHGFTTNTNQSTGDGLTAAFRAGAKLSNLEFVQFHPTGLRGSGILISESARGAGGILVTENGERFVDELKPRDVVSRAIWEQMQKGERVYLDIRHLGEAFIDENIPQERKLCLTYAGVDPVHECIPITPVAHYSMGGIDVDTTHMSSVEGLFAVGECANAHIHGANRLGGNSLLEIVAFGKEAGLNAAAYARKRQYVSENLSVEKAQKQIASLLDAHNETDFYEKREELGALCYREAGIIRDGTQLSHALHTVGEMLEQLPQMGLFDRSSTYNTNLVERIKFENSLQLAQMVLRCAQEREESRGAHYRSDFPEPDKNYAKESLCEAAEGGFTLSFREVLS